MKQLLLLIVIVLPLFATAQPDSTNVNHQKEVIKELLIVKATKQKSIDSLQSLKLKELKKQNSLLAKIQVAIKKLLADTKAKPQPEIATIPILEAMAVKPTADSIFCEDCFFEEAQRTFFGKIFNTKKYRVRTYRYENNEKIYLD